MSLGQTENFEKKLNDGHEDSEGMIMMGQKQHDVSGGTK